MTLKNWFKGDLGVNFRKLQREDNVLARIALTAMDPDHPDGLRRSCHRYTALMLRHHLPEGNIIDSDEIVLLGMGDTVYHSIITRGNDEILSDDTSPNGEVRIDIAAERYHSDWYEQTNPGQAKDMKIVKRMSIGDFKAKYINNISLGHERGLDEGPA